MNHPNITIGHIIRVKSEAEAVSVMGKFKDVAGVIWNDPVYLPFLDDSQSDELTRFHVTWDRENGYGFVRQEEGDLRLATLHKPVPIARAPRGLEEHFELAVRDIHTVNQMGPHAARRKQWFLKDNDLRIAPHLDDPAKVVWLHRHMEGSGLKIYYPTDGQPISLWVGIRKSSSVQMGNIQPLIKSGTIATLELQENDVVAFNHNMLHESNSGSRLRGAVNGYQL